MLKRLSVLWEFSNCILFCDSYFFCVETAEALIYIGLKFDSVLKAATAKYPISHLSTFELHTRGAHTSFALSDHRGSNKLLALVSVDRKRRYFIQRISICHQVICSLDLGRGKQKQEPEALRLPLSSRRFYKRRILISCKDITFCAKWRVPLLYDLIVDMKPDKGMHFYAAQKKIVIRLISARYIE